MPYEEECTVRLEHGVPGGLDTLKAKLSTAPVLTISSNDGTFVVYTDISLADLGDVSMQTQRVVTYVSR